jgi:hypothetical protein
MVMVMSTVVEMVRMDVEKVIIVVEMVKGGENGDTIDLCGGGGDGDGGNGEDSGGNGKDGCGNG